MGAEKREPPRRRAKRGRACTKKALQRCTDSAARHHRSGLALDKFNEEERRRAEAATSSTATPTEVNLAAEVAKLKAELEKKEDLFKRKPKLASQLQETIKKERESEG